MKTPAILLFALFFVACKTKPAKDALSFSKITPVAQAKTTSNPLNNSNNNASTDTAKMDDSEGLDAYADYYVVVADTGNNYHDLHSKMFALNQSLKIPIDTMGRGYNSKKNLIALPDDNEDEMYAGEYFPRRYPSDALSLEYIQQYKDGSAEKTIALVTGIYATKAGADSALTTLGASANAFAIKAHIYVGCMH